MKLYFHILEQKRNSNESTIKIVEREAVIKNGAYFPKDKKFPGRYHVWPFEINSRSGRRWEPVVILLEPDLKKAAEIMKPDVEKECNRYKDLVDIWENKIKAIEGVLNDGGN